MRRTLLGLICWMVLVGVSPAQGREASILWMQGDVQLEEPGGGAVRPAAVTDVAPEGSRVITGKGAECGIGFDGGLEDSALKLLPEASVRIADLGDQAYLDLEGGSVLVNLKNLPAQNRFEVRSPTAVAAARGTAWLQSNEAIEVFDGSVHVSAASGEAQDIEKNEATELTASGSFGAKRPASESSQHAWNDFLQDLVKNVLRPEDIQDIRNSIDAKRASPACGGAAPYPWELPVPTGSAVRVSPVNELKKALSEAPFAQTETYVRDFLDPIPDLTASGSIHLFQVRRLRKALENAACG